MPPCMQTFADSYRVDFNYTYSCTVIIMIIIIVIVIHKYSNWMQNSTS